MAEFDFVASLTDGAIGFIVGAVATGVYKWWKNERHKLTIYVERDGGATESVHTKIYVHNTGSHFERDVRLYIQASVSHDDSVRLLHYQNETNTLIPMNESKTHQERPRFLDFNFVVSAEWLETGDEILAVLVSNHHIPTLKVIALSNATVTTHNIM